MKNQAEIVNCRLGFIFLISHHKIDRVILLIGILVIDRRFLSLFIQNIGIKVIDTFFFIR